jgi:hypothetical protein
MSLLASMVATNRSGVFPKAANRRPFRFQKEPRQPGPLPLQSGVVSRRLMLDSSRSWLHRLTS